MDMEDVQDTSSNEIDTTPLEQNIPRDQQDDHSQFDNKEKKDHYIKHRHEILQKPLYDFTNKNVLTLLKSKFSDVDNSCIKVLDIPNNYEKIKNNRRGGYNPPTDEASSSKATPLNPRLNHNDQLTNVENFHVNNINNYLSALKTRRR
ncbi:hypothetical protein RhiirA4_456486 [Rhizophagus irregularis]|uniref:Uncharacterized protein n=1 Tax=Rhizophagus irregularis TaxID=588596 RepID=A0A2I1G7S6_9GLOM|nr:hypothetical protein RhiirA4_456486 [Rhizophagus irregularis]